MVDVFDVLTEARSWVDKGWTQGYPARTAEGLCTRDVSDPEATSWCVVGGIWKALAELGVWSLEHDARVLFEDVVGCNPATWNDDPWRTKEQVLEALDRAIARAARPMTVEGLTEVLDAHGWAEVGA